MTAATPTTAVTQDGGWQIVFYGGCRPAEPGVTRAAVSYRGYAGAPTP